MPFHIDITFLIRNELKLTYYNWRGVVVLYCEKGYIFITEEEKNINLFIQQLHQMPVQSDLLSRLSLLVQ